MHYRAGTYGLTGIGVRDDVPHWYCDCGGWRFNASAMPRAKTGNNLAAAQRSWAAHAAISIKGGQS